MAEDKKGSAAPTGAQANLGTTAADVRPSATAQREAEESAIPRGKERGSQLEIAGGEPQPDFAGPTPRKPTGLQAEEALFTTNGTVPGGMVGSPTGPVPVAAVAASPEQAEELLEQREKALKREGRRSALEVELTDEEIDRMSGAELRSVALARGYRDFPEAGTRASREAFRTAQEEDERLQERLRAGRKRTARKRAEA